MRREADRPKKLTGFALMDPEKRKRIARMASDRAKRLGHRHRWDPAGAALARMNATPVLLAAGNRRRWTSETARQAALRRWAENRRPDARRTDRPMRACDATLLMLLESGVDALYSDDRDMMEAIAVRGRLQCQGGGRRTMLAIRIALVRNPGQLVKTFARSPSGRKVTIWALPGFISRQEAPVPPDDRAGRPMRACDATLLVLRETGRRSVCRDDHDLLQAIAVRGRLRCQGGGRRTVIAVLRSLTRDPGRLATMRVRSPSGRSRLEWYRPECAPRSKIRPGSPLPDSGGTPSPPPCPSA